MYEKTLSVDKLKVFSDLLIYVSFLIILLYLFLTDELGSLGVDFGNNNIVFNEVKCTYLT